MLMQCHEKHYQLVSSSVSWALDALIVRPITQCTIRTLEMGFYTCIYGEISLKTREQSFTTLRVFLIIFMLSSLKKTIALLWKIRKFLSDLKHLNGGCSLNGLEVVWKRCQCVDLEAHRTAGSLQKRNSNCDNMVTSWIKYLKLRTHDALGSCATRRRTGGRCVPANRLTAGGRGHRLPVELWKPRTEAVCLPVGGSSACCWSRRLHRGLFPLSGNCDQGGTFTYFLGGNCCPHWLKSRGIQIINILI